MSIDPIKLCRACDEPVTRPRAKYCEECRKYRAKKFEQRFEPREYPEKAAPVDWYDDWDAYAGEYD